MRSRRQPNPVNRVYESNGPDVKVRGTPQQIVEKYTQLGRDALSSGDDVKAESYFQHAEHYQRIILAAQEQIQARRQQQEQRRQGSRQRSEQPDTEPNPAPAAETDHAPVTQATDDTRETDAAWVDEVPAFLTQGIAPTEDDTRDDEERAASQERATGKPGTRGNGRRRATRARRSNGGNRAAPPDITDTPPPPADDAGASSGLEQPKDTH